MTLWVLITGASRGIGAAAARRLAADGFSVALNCRQNQDQAAQVAAEIQAAGGQAQLLAFDVSDRQACRAALERFLAEHGAFYGVLLSAGIAADGLFAAMPGEDWDRVLGTNLGGAYNVLHPLILPMIKTRQGGRIVALSSVTALKGNKGQANYGASKAGLIGLVKSLALELASRKITVNAVAPGLIETEMIEGLDLSLLLKQIPAGRLGQPEEVAALVSYLFSPQAGYLTGQVISLDGGLT
ncbi:MAG: 3-oxoacyl-ACP reductase FabG [bacterium]|nr:3-oxoacyl-ACP reductase FabG [bacterium]